MMTVTFFSSVLNHHQMPFCQAMRRIPGVEFSFVQMIELTKERKAMGFVAEEEHFVVNAMQEPEKAYRLCMDSDVVIAGVIHQNWVNERIKKGKLTFAYKERFCKNRGDILKPSFWKNGYLNYFRFRNKNLYLLCASAYTAKDTRLIFPRKDKKRKWGYFPEISEIQNQQAHLAEKQPGTILWAGRFLGWKHPEVCIAVAKRLKAENITFKMDVVGLGEMENELKKQIAKNALGDCVEVLGQLPPEQVRRQMAQHQIFLFTSDRQEGWGAVLNEAMSEGCACVASKQAGSTCFLIQNGKNGFSYAYDDVDTLYARVKYLLEDPMAMYNVQAKAMDTIHKEWNAETAAQRLIAFSKAILEGREGPCYTTGPMSKAQ